MYTVHPVPEPVIFTPVQIYFNYENGHDHIMYKYYF